MEIFSKKVQKKKKSRMNQDHETDPSSTSGTRGNSKIMTVLRFMYANADGLVGNGKELESNDRVE